MPNNTVVPNGNTGSLEKFMEFIAPRTPNEIFAIRPTRPRLFYPQQGITYAIRFLGNVVRTQRHYVKHPQANVVGGNTHLLSPDDLRGVVDGNKTIFNRIMRELFGKLSATSQEQLRPILQSYTKPHLVSPLTKLSIINVPKKQYAQDNLIVQIMREIHLLYVKDDWKTCVISHIYVRRNSAQISVSPGAPIGLAMPTMPTNMSGLQAGQNSDVSGEPPLSLMCIGAQLYNDMMSTIARLPNGFQSPISGVVAHDIFVSRSLPGAQPSGVPVGYNRRNTTIDNSGGIPHYDVDVSPEPSMLTEKELQNIYAYGFFDIPQALKTINNKTATDGNGLIYRLAKDCSGSISDDIRRMADADIGTTEVAALQQKADNIPDALFEKTDQSSTVGSIEI